MKAFKDKNVDFVIKCNKIWYNHLKENKNVKGKGWSL